jgi:integrase
VLSDSELAEMWSAASMLGYPFGPVFELLTLTMQRREEVAGMRWSEIADDLSVWTMPGSRMKNGKPHDVHLSEAARAILREIPRVEGCDLVFSTTGRTPISGFSKAKIALDVAITDSGVSPIMARLVLWLGCRSGRLCDRTIPRAAIGSFAVRERSRPAPTGEVCPPVRDTRCWHDAT